MASTSSPVSGLRGVQRPRIMHLPPSASRSTTVTGDDAIELAALAGLDLDPWQQLVLRESLAERPDGKWSAFEVGQVVPRQNGKNAILEARELVGLFLLEQERLIVHTAHEFPTAMEHFLRIRALVEDCPDLAAKVRSITMSNGKEGIELKDGSRLRFKARTGGSGRGFTGDLVVLDEAFELKPAQMRALLHTLSARPNPQLWYASTAVDQTEQPNGLVLAGVRERGMAGRGSRLAYFEWSIDEKTFWDNPEKVASDPEVWAQANPALGIRIDPDHVATELETMESDLRGFGVERLGVGDWPDTSEGAKQVIPAPIWDGLLDSESKADGRVAFAFDVTPERDYAAIGMGGRREDGLRHVEVVDHRAGTRWVVAELVRLRSKWDPCVVVVDGKSPAASLIPELASAGIKVMSSDGPSDDELVWKVNTGEMAQACGAFYDACMAEESELRHLGQSWLDRALSAAKTRDLSDAWAWARKSGGDISPLVAVTLAAHGHAVYGSPEEAVPMVTWA